MTAEEKTTKEIRTEDIIARQKSGWFCCTSMDYSDEPFEKTDEADIATFLLKEKKLFSVIPRNHIVLEIKGRGGIKPILDYLSKRCATDFLAYDTYVVYIKQPIRHFYFKKDPRVSGLDEFELKVKGVRVLTYPERVPLPYQSGAYIQRGSIDNLTELSERVLRKLGDLRSSITDREVQEILSIDQIGSVDRELRLEEFCKAVSRLSLSSDLAIETAIEWDKENEPPFGKDYITSELQAYSEISEKAGKRITKSETLKLISNDPLFKDVFYFNDREQRIAMRTNPFPACKTPEDRITDEWLSVATYHISSRHLVEVSNKQLIECIQVLSQRCRIHPVKEQIQSFYAANQRKLERMGLMIGFDYHPHSTIDNFFHTYCGLPLTSYLVDVARILFSTLIGRTFKERYKSDHLIILRGIQGIYKSTMCQILAIKDDWFDNTFTLEESSQKLMEKTSASLISEWQELQGYKNLKENKLKAVLSTTGQVIRKAYGHVETFQKVGYVVVATTNASDFVYTPDTSRRLLPVLLTQPIDTEKLRKDIPLLYAEAYKRFLTHPVHSLRTKSKKLHELCTIECSEQDESLTKILINWLTGGCVETFQTFVRLNPTIGWFSGRRKELKMEINIVEILPEDLVRYYKVFDMCQKKHSYSELKSIVEHTLGALGYSPKTVKVKDVIKVEERSATAIPNSYAHLGDNCLRTMYFLRGEKLKTMTRKDKETGMVILKKTEEALGVFAKICTPDEEEEELFFDEMTEEQKIKHL